MILKKAKPRYNTGQIRTIEKFAWLPRQMKTNEYDDLGEWIWLEKYIVTEKYDRNSWKLLSCQRLSSAMLEKLQNN
jgi:hypothetical protein